MLDEQKIKELDAMVPVLELEESNYRTYEKLAILKSLKFFQEIENAGGVRSLLKSADLVEEPQYSYSPAPTVETSGDSDFLALVSGKDSASVFSVIDELMDTLRIVNEQVYNGVMKKLRNL